MADHPAGCLGKCSGSIRECLSNQKEDPPGNRQILFLFYRLLCRGQVAFGRYTGFLSTVTKVHMRSADLKRPFMPVSFVRLCALLRRSAYAGGECFSAGPDSHAVISAFYAA